MDRERYEQYINWMKYQKESRRDNGEPDIEAIHRGGDYVLCEFLRAIGYEELVDAYEELPKWYA